MELLNLDELVKTTRKVQVGGKIYPVIEQTVEQMIEAIRISKLVEDNQDDAESILNAMLTTAKRLLPDCPEAILNRLNMRQLAALIQFASASDEDAAAVAKETAPSGEVLAEKTTP